MSNGMTPPVAPADGSSSAGLHLPPGSEKAASCQQPGTSIFQSSWRLCAIFLGGALFGAFFWLIFPQGDPRLWPPAVKNDRYRVFVTVNSYHTCINIPDYNLGKFHEWHMGAREWYLSSGSTLLDVAVKATVGKLRAVIMYGVFSLPYWQREAIPMSKVFTFWLSPEGFLRLQKSLHAFRGKDMERQGNYWYFSYTRGYHMLENCNNFTARALISAGLPMREILAQEGWSMTWQLQRCQALQQDALGNSRPTVASETK